MANKTLEIIIGAKNRTAAAFTAVKSGLGKIKDSVFNVKTAIGGLLVGAGFTGLAKSFLDTADATEQLRLRLEVLLGSAEEGGRLFDDMRKYAARVPFTFNEIVQSATMLSGILKGGREEINEWIPRIGNLAAATGLSIQETTEQISRMLSAGAASADLFRERGVLALLGFQAGVSYTADETKKKLAEILDSKKFQGATDKLASSWSGLMSMFQDKWDEFKQAVADSGVFEALKRGANAVLEQLNKIDIKKAARETGVAILAVLKIVVQAVPQAVVIVLQSMQKISMVFRGWAMLIQEIKIAWFSVAEFIQKGFQQWGQWLNTLLSLGNVNGVFEGQLKALAEFNGSQEAIIRQIQKDKADAIAAQNKTIDGYNKEQQALDELTAKVEATQKYFDEFAKSLEIGDKATAEFSKATNAADEYLKKLDQIAAKQQYLSFGGGPKPTGTVFGDAQHIRELQRTEGQ